MPHNKTNSDQMALVNEHITSFPAVAAHYTRKDTNRKFLGADLNIRKMYDLYKEWVKDKGVAVSHYVYRKTFNDQHNFSFHKPRKDQCELCTKYDIAKEAGKVDKQLQLLYDDHHKSKQAAREAKEADKKEAGVNPSYHSATFDLEAVLTTPCTRVSQLYYKRKLSVYNLSVYSLGNHRADCYVWNETNGKRGSCEIGTCLYLYISSLRPPVKHVCFYSDCCTGQNRNRFIAIALLHAVQNTHIEIIDHRIMFSQRNY